MRTNHVPALAEAPYQSWRISVRPYPGRRISVRLYIAAALLLLAITLSAETLASQGFEASPSDTWAYTANPAGMTRLVWWGRSDQPMGGASAQNGDWYWGSWDLDNTDHSLSFANVSLPTGYNHSISFWYYTNGLTGSDYSRFCVEYDNGDQWNNWVTLSPDTDAWTQMSLDIPPQATTVRLKVSALYDGFAKYAHWDNFVLSSVPAPPTAPLVYNASVQQRLDGSRIVDIYYDIFDANNDLCTVALLLSSDNGVSFQDFPNPANLSGDLGPDIANGTGKHIVWNAGADGIAYDASTYRIRIVADDGSIPIPENFVLVPGGTFLMGDTRGAGNSNELPVHSVTLNPFYIGKYEVTQAEYALYMPGSNWTSSYGLGDNYPAYYVSWYAILKYCNLRSLAEGLTPVYSISGSTNPADWGAVPTNYNTAWDAAICNWSANGYRLPTEAEWEYAARGGSTTPDYIYSGSNDINTVAWYSGNSGLTSHPVGTKAPNGISTFDMSGNVWEWCWDWYSSSYYSSSPASNPTGPASGTGRVIRGGYWVNDAYDCRVANRSVNYPTYSYCRGGFRVCRVSL